MKYAEPIMENHGADYRIVITLQHIECWIVVWKCKRSTSSKRALLLHQVYFGKIHRLSQPHRYLAIRIHTYHNIVQAEKFKNSKQSIKLKSLEMLRNCQKTKIKTKEWSAQRILFEYQHDLGLEVSLFNNNNNNNPSI